MGLDLILENRNKKHYGNDDWHELAYGRKTWVIANFFRDRNEAIDGDWVYHVTRKSWDEFVATIHPYATNAEFLNAVARVTDYEWDHNKPYPSDEDDTLIRTAIESLNDDSWTQLGDSWEINAILNWYNANYEVQEAFNRGDEIRLIVSY
jgi:hypothetical protein